MIRRKWSAMFLFTCILVYLASTVSADDPIVTIIETNPVVDPVEKAIVSEKNFDVQLTCSVENRPEKAKVQWVSELVINGTKTPVPISVSTKSFDPIKYSIDVPSPTSLRLRIQNGQVTDEGVYTCQVQLTSQNYAKASERLIIVEKPVIDDLETSTDVDKSEGTSLTLRCSASGRPTPTVKWTRMAGELLPSGGREHLRSILNIPVLKPEHAGIYKCSASNSAGSDYREIRVTVNYPPLLTSAHKVVMQAPGYVKELICDIQGYPAPVAESITWTKRGDALGFDPHVFVRTIPGASSRVRSMLIFWGVQEGDYGEYTCSATNDGGTRRLKFSLQRSTMPTEDRTGVIRSGSSILAVNILTVLMVLSVCVLQRLGCH